MRVYYSSAEAPYTHMYLNRPNIVFYGLSKAGPVFCIRSKVEGQKIRGIQWDGGQLRI